MSSSSPTASRIRSRSAATSAVLMWVIRFAVAVRAALEQRLLVRLGPLALLRGVRAQVTGQLLVLDVVVEATDGVALTHAPGVPGHQVEPLGQAVREGGRGVGQELQAGAARTTGVHDQRSDPVRLRAGGGLAGQGQLHGRPGRVGRVPWHVERRALQAGQRGDLALAAAPVELAGRVARDGGGGLTGGRPLRRLLLGHRRAALGTREGEHCARGNDEGERRAGHPAEATDGWRRPDPGRGPERSRLSGRRPAVLRIRTRSGS